MFIKREACRKRPPELTEFLPPQLAPKTQRRLAPSLCINTIYPGNPGGPMQEAVSKGDLRQQRVSISPLPPGPSWHTLDTGGVRKEGWRCPGTAAPQSLSQKPVDVHLLGHNVDMGPLLTCESTQASLTPVPIGSGATPLLIHELRHQAASKHWGRRSGLALSRREGNLSRGRAPPGEGTNPLTGMAGWTNPLTVPIGCGATPRLTATNSCIRLPEPRDGILLSKERGPEFLHRFPHRRC